ncbi:glycoside hydrolase family 140 protein [Chlorogloeopsis sp. ULAP02]|uniref:glycoside hydrolase family 140 protein n=1 Tax=Chlorogloeopsis sp. ULAP02 TaxID=3107926 RepID=UPI003134D9C8
MKPNKHYLFKEDGKPFFYLGDTAWELFHRLNREEALIYLHDRARKGFTVIQAVVLAELNGLKQPNPYGYLPLKNHDPTKPNEAYFQHIDYIVNKAEEMGLYIGMLPTWGDKWNKKWGVGPEIFTPTNAEVFGLYLGKRYQNKPIIWILGGDRNPENDTHLAIIRAMAKGLKQGDGGNHLMTYHPQGGSNSATWFENDDWLDFNMFQSGHKAINLPNYEITSENYLLNPPKPTLDGEPRYEDHPIDWNPENGWFDEFDVRQAAYWSMLAGACGHTYGNHNIWQMWEPNQKPISAARTPWRKALRHPGAIQMGYLRRLFESRPFTKLVPDQSLIVGDVGEGMDHLRAACAEDGSFAFVYTPTGKPITAKLGKIKGSKVKAYWYDPRGGVARQIAELLSMGTKEFIPPTRGRGNDWILVLDNAAINFSAPGDD